MEIINYICTHAHHRQFKSLIVELDQGLPDYLPLYCTVRRLSVGKVANLLTSLGFWILWNCLWKRKTVTILSSQTLSGLFLWAFWSTCCGSWDRLNLTLWGKLTRPGAKCVWVCQQTEAAQDACAKGKFNIFINIICLNTFIFISFI